MSRRAWQWSGPILTAALVGLVWGVVHFGIIEIANPMMIFVLGVVFSALMGGLFPGLVATAIAIGGLLVIVSADAGLASLGRLPARIGVNLSVAVVLATLIAHLRGRIVRSASEPVRQEQDIFRGIIRTLHDAILECDWQGIRDVNPSFCRMTGFSREELVRCRPPYPFWPMEEYAKIAAALEKAMRGVALDFELVLTRKCGERFPVLLSVSRVTEGDTTARVVYSFRDITELKKAQASLEQSELHFKTALGSANVSIFEVDAKRRMVRPSATLARLMGVARGTEVELGRICAAVHELDRAGFRQSLDRSLATAGAEFRAEFRVRGAGGEQRWLLSAGQVLRDAQGAADRLYGVTWDITERRAREEAARAGEAWLTAALEAARMATWDWDLATNTGRGSLRLRDLFGLGPGAEAGPVTEYLAMIHPDDRGVVEASIAHTVAGNTPCHAEFRILYADGHVTWLSAFGMAMDYEGGPPRRLMGVAVDITLEREAKERLRWAEAALREAQARFREAVEVSGVGVWEQDLASGKVTWNDNQERIFGLAPGTFDGRYETFRQCIHPDDLAEVEAHLARAMALHEPEEHVLRVVWPDGSIHWIEARGRCVFDADGRPLRLVGVVHALADGGRDQRSA